MQQLTHGRAMPTFLYPRIHMEMSMNSSIILAGGKCLLGTYLLTGVLSTKICVLAAWRLLDNTYVQESSNNINFSFYQIRENANTSNCKSGQVSPRTVSLGGVEAERSNRGKETGNSNSREFGLYFYQAVSPKIAVFGPSREAWSLSRQGILPHWWYVSMDQMIRVYQQGHRANNHPHLSKGSGIASSLFIPAIRLLSNSWTSTTLEHFQVSYEILVCQSRSSCRTDIQTYEQFLEKYQSLLCIHVSNMDVRLKRYMAKAVRRCIR